MGDVIQFRDFLPEESLRENFRKNYVEIYHCPCCGAALAPEEAVFMDASGVVGCLECVTTGQAWEVLGLPPAA